MNPKGLSLALTLLLVFNASETEANFITAAISGVFDLTNFIIDLVDIFDGNEEPDNSVDVQAILDNVKETVERVSDIQFQRITAYLQLDKLDEVRRKVYSALVSLQYFLSSKQGEREQYKILFTRNSYSAIEAARSLPSLLKESLPSSKHNMLQYVSQASRCNATALDTFQEYCRNLLVNGRLIELVSKSIEYNLTLESELRYWNNSLDDLNESLSQQTYRCKVQFRSFLGEDIGNADNTTELQHNNTERYNWFWNDVLFVETTVSETDFYFEGAPDAFVSNTTNGYRKLVIVGEKGKVYTPDFNQTVDSFVAFYAAYGLLNSAKELVDEVKDHLLSHNLNVCAIGAIFTDWEAEYAEDGAPGRRIMTTTVKTIHGESNATLYFFVNDIACEGDVISEKNIVSGSMSVSVAVLKHLTVVCFILLLKRFLFC